MRRQFIRMLLSIVGIALLLLAVQSVLLVVFNRIVARNWTQEVFDEFVASIDDAINKASLNSGDGVFNVMVNNTSERISGLIIRDEKGEFVFSLGATPRGVPVPQLDTVPSLDTSSEAMIKGAKLRVAENSETSKGVEYKIKKPQYEMAVSADILPSGNAGKVTDVVLKELNQKGKVSVVYPRSIDDKDIAGTVIITINGEIAGYIDVLVYNVDYYTPTRFLMFELVRCFLMTLPIVIVISIIAAYNVSKKTEKQVKAFQDALDALANGEHGVKIPDSKVTEYQDIKKSIEKLDADLQRHSKSRKEWIKNISHDLNTPVTSMNILIGGAMDGIFPVNEELIASLKKENDNLTDKIASVSYYSYLLSPEVKFNPQVNRLMDIADTTLQSYKSKCIVDFSLETYIFADTALAERAILEVVKNATEYSEEGTEPVLASQERDDRTIVTITNKGKLPSPRPQFFEPWARGDDSRTSGGSGLGLPIVYQIMEIHGGSVAITENGGEVVVTLVFPKRK